MTNKPNIPSQGDDYGVAVPIVTFLEDQGITIAEDVEGYALSSPFGPELYAVCYLVRENGKAKLGPMLGDACAVMSIQRNTLRQGVLTAMWAAARMAKVTDELQRAWNEHALSHQEGVLIDRAWDDIKEARL